MKVKRSELLKALENFFHNERFDFTGRENTRAVLEKLVKELKHYSKEIKNTAAFNQLKKSKSNME